MTTLWHDIRYAIRMLAKSPRFTTVAVLSLALGIGANTAVFSAINAVLLRSLPVRNPHELRLINWVGLNPQLNSYTGIGTSDVPGGLEMGASFPYPAYRDFRDRGTGFTSVFAFASKKVTAIARGEASAAVAMLVSGNYFSGYGVEPLIGRSIEPPDDRPGVEPVAVLLSCIGLYGLVAYNATRRTREIGLRMALGATRRNVAGSILREALRLVLVGLSVGMPAALAVARFIKSQLYGVAPADPVTLVAGGFMMTAVALLSAWIPARRATSVDPMVALRCE